MTLKEFIENFVCPNTLIRLWKEIKGGHEMIWDENDTDKVVGMNWEITKGKGWQSKYADCKVIGVTDIVCDDFYREAVNIVIEP